MKKKQSTHWRKFVLLSDLHLHPWAAFSKGEGGSNSRLHLSLAVLSASLKRAQDLNVPWVFAGDIVHTAGYTLNVVMAELANVLLMYPDVLKLAVWGNHDARGIGGKIKLSQTVLSTLYRAVPNFVVLDEVGFIEKNGLRYSGRSYQPRPEFLEYALESDVGVYHQTVAGTKTPNGFELEEGISGAELMKRHRVAVVGHVHHWQYHTAAQKLKGQLLLIPGAPEQHNFGDTGEHGYWVIEVPTDPKAEILRAMIPSGSPQFVTVDSPREVKNDGNYYRVRSIGIGEKLPQGAAVIGSAPTAVEQRNILEGARGEAVVEAWAKVETPDGLDLQRVLSAGKGLLSVRETANLQPYQLSHISIKNFCSYGSVDMAVEPGTWLVVGHGKDFPSNGAGKSTLFEAFYWALFGATTKGLTGDDVIRWGEKDCSVTAALVDPQGSTCTITRSRGAKSTLRVVLTDEPSQQVEEIEGKSVNEVSEKLQKFLGVTPDLYKALCYFSQEDLVLFASATDGKRKDMLADLIGLGVYADASTAAGRKAEELRAAEQRVDATKEAAGSRAVSEQKRLDDATVRSAEWAGAHASRLATAETALSTFDGQADQLRAQMEAEQRELLGRSLASREQQVAEQLAVAQAEAAKPAEQTYTQKEFIDANTAEGKAREDLRAHVATIEATKRQQIAQEARIAAYKKQLAAGVCPTCQQTVSAEHIDTCLVPVTVELGEIHSALQTMEGVRIQLVQTAADAKLRAREVAAGYEHSKVLQQRTKDLHAAQAASLEVQTQRDALEFTVGVSVVKGLEQHRDKLVAAIDAIKRERNPYAVEQDSIKQRIAEAEAEAAQLAQQQTEILGEIAIYEYWRHGFSKQGLQSLLLDEIAGLFNECRGSIFPALTQGVYDVQFSTLSRTKAGEARERTEFQVFERSKPVPYNSLSGGQRRRIDVGVMLVLVKAVSRWMQVPGALGLMVLDEVCGFLDNSGAEGLMEALREMQEQIPAIFVVSHDSQLQALFPEVITVVQEQNGVSRIEGAA